MRIQIFLIVSTILAGCANPLVEPNPITTAQSYVGLQEWQNRAELTELLGLDPVRTEWCAAFANAILEMDNIPSLNTIESRAPLLAKSFLTWGDKVNSQDIKKGDLVIFPRGNQGWQGHVGFYIATLRSNGTEKYVILGGNQDKSVNYSIYPAQRAIGIRRWPDTADSERSRFMLFARLR
jgi:uncharacterized protein (TIGR02594 family)|tara:strand:+ start:1060 stop:1599 length:540 start_codon:yes stop_codon:yes gene_type:complete